MADTEMIIHFGKHKGEKICNVPSDYLKWLAENIDDAVGEAANEEYAFRERYGGHKW